MEAPVLLRRFVAFLRRDDGPTSVEYAVMLALIIVVCVGAISQLGGNASSTFGKVFAGSSSSPSNGLSGTSWGSYGDVISFSTSDNTFSFDGGAITGTITSAGNNTYNFTASDGERGTFTVSGNNLTVTETTGSRTYTKR